MLYFLLSAILVVIDQLVKVWVRESLPLGGSAPFLPHLLDLTYVQNTGAAFSFLAGADLTWLLALVSLAATVLLAAVIAKRPFKHPLALLSVSLVLGGAAGNLIDRALFGFVTDMFRTVFLDFPVFNVADVCVVCGSALFLFYLLVLDGRGQPPVEEQPPEEQPPVEEQPHDEP